MALYRYMQFKKSAPILNDNKLIVNNDSKK